MGLYVFLPKPGYDLDRCLGTLSVRSWDMGIPPPPTLMRVDPPFFCAIRDNATETLLFAEAIRNPQ